MLARKRREMRKWAETNKKNKKTLRPVYQNTTPRDNFNKLVIKNKSSCNENNSNIKRCGIPIQNYNRKNLLCNDKNNDIKVPQCGLKKTNFQIKNSIIKRIENKNGIHNPCYHHNYQKYLINRNKQFIEHPEDFKQKKYRENCKTSYCKKSALVCNDIQTVRYTNPAFSKKESVSSRSRLHRLKHQTITKVQNTHRAKKQNVMNGMMPLSLYLPTGPTKQVIEPSDCSEVTNKKRCKKTVKWCKPPCKCPCE